MRNNTRNLTYAFSRKHKKITDRPNAAGLDSPTWAIRRQTVLAAHAPILHKIMDLVRALPLQNQERIEQILDQAARRYGGPEETPAAFYADRKARIERYVEEPCRALTERLLDMGHRTHASNAYGVGPKGVFWSRAEKNGHTQDGQAMSCYFTSLANGQTYVWTLHNAFPVPEITQTVQVEDTLPYGVRELPHQLLFNAQPPFGGAETGTLPATPDENTYIPSTSF